MGVTPVLSAAMQSCVASCTERAPCSMSMNSQSKPAAFASIGAATVRNWLTPKPSESWPARRRRSAVLVTMGMRKILPWFG